MKREGYQILQNTDLIPIINQNKIDLEYKTDTHFSYCNTNYAFLALIIEKITKVSYAQALEKLIHLLTELLTILNNVFNCKSL